MGGFSAMGKRNGEIETGVSVAERGMGVSVMCLKEFGNLRQLCSLLTSELPILFDFHFLAMFSCVGGSDTPVASMLPGQLKLQPPREALELFQRLQLLKNTHYASEGIIDESTKKRSGCGSS
ncbi:hypothetical protein TB2_047182 [Malus domestica]